MTSVVIPAYNRADCIERAIDSCLRQHSACVLEVLVVDDASTDDTAAVVESIDDPRVHLMRHRDNRGGAAARNTGIQAARGDYIAFLDSDDTWDPDKLNTQLRALAGHDKPHLLVCHCQSREITPFGMRVLPKLPRAPGVNIAEYLFVQRGHIQTGSLLVPAQLARDVGFDAQCRKHQDYDFCLRLEQHGAEFLFVEQPLLNWHHDNRSDRITNLYGVEASEQFLRIRERVLGRRSADAFWVKHIFPQKARVSPVVAVWGLVKRMTTRSLSLGWYFEWLYTGIKRARRRTL